MSKSVKVVVTVPKAKEHPLSTVVEQMKDVGLDVEKIHDKLGVVTGMIAADKIHKLSAIEGVSLAREERSVRLVAPPPR